VQKAAVVEIKQSATTSATAIKISHQKTSHQKNPSSFRESFISSGKKGDEATVLQKGCNIVTKKPVFLLL
jgi:hypothetical protein